MDSYMARQRYMQRRRASYGRHGFGRSGVNMRRGRLRRLIAIQTLICIVIFLVVIIAKNIDFSAARFVTDNARYILEHNVEPENIYAYAKTQAAGMRDRIAGGKPQADDRTDETERNMNGETSALRPDETGENRTDEAGRSRTAGSPTVDDGGAEVGSNSLSVQNAFADTVDASSGINNSIDDAPSSYADNVGEIHETGVLSASSGDEGDPAAGLSGDGSGSALLEAPAEGEIVTPFGEIEAAAGMRKMHYGIDIAIEGTSGVKAVLDGYVTDTGSSPVYGNYIKISHTGGLVTVYANCSSVAAQVNDFVKKGDVIAGVGGESITGGRHLHFEVWRNGVPADPLDYISLTAR